MIFSNTEGFSVTASDDPITSFIPTSPLVHIRFNDIDTPIATIGSRFFFFAAIDLMRKDDNRRLETNLIPWILYPIDTLFRSAGVPDVERIVFATYASDIV
jgi:hypothetical protein